MRGQCHPGRDCYRERSKKAIRHLETEGQKQGGRGFAYKLDAILLIYGHQVLQVLLNGNTAHPKHENAAFSVRKRLLDFK